MEMQAESQHLTRAELEAYGAKSLAAAQLLSADRHLGSCGVCRHELWAAVVPPPLPALLPDAERPLHLRYEEMTAYIEAALDEQTRERAEQHMLICASCSREVRELQAFDLRVERELQAQAIAPPPPTWLEQGWQSLKSFLASPQRLRYATAGFAAMLLGVFMMLQVRVSGNGISSARSMEHVARVSASPHAGLVYGGLLLAISGLLVLLYGLVHTRK
jgi:hypothetical protein